MNIKVDFDNIVVKEDKNDFNVKVLMLKGEKGDAGDGEPNVIETVQVNGTALPVTNKTVNVPVPTIDSAISSSSTNPVQNKAIYNALSDKVNTSELNNYYEISEVDALLNKKTYHFSSVAEMKAYNLSVGDMVITKGYYTANDSGGANYEIVEDNTLINNNMNIIKLDNNLFAKMIINNEININSFGADNTGTNDSSTIFNYAFNLINDNWLSGNYKINTVITNGKYLWNNQVKMPPCARLRTSGYTTIFTNVSGSALLIDYLSTTQPTNFAGNKQDWLFAELINFSNGGIFKNVGDNLTGTCIEIGRDSNIGATLPHSRYKLCNFRIYNYNIGILHNKYHDYIGKFDNISFETNNIGVQYGLSATAVNDSGENMTYNNCLFSSSTDAIRWLNDSFDSSFINCSFDFVTNVFDDYGNQGYKRISVVNSHIEGITYICNKLGGYSALDINNSSIITTKHGNIFSNISTTSIVSLSNNKIISQGTSEYDPTKLIDQCDNISLLNNTSQDALQLMFNNANMITNFDKLEDGDISNFGANSQIGIFKVEDLSGNTFTAKIVTDNYLYTGHKSLVFVGTTNVTSNKIMVLVTDYIPLNNIQKILKANIFTHNCRGSQGITYRFYDANKNLIKETSGYQNVPANSNKTANQWYMTPFCKYERIPISASYVKVRIAITNMNNSTADEIGTEYKLGAVIVN